MAMSSKSFSESSTESSSKGLLLFLGLILIINIPIIVARPLHLSMKSSIWSSRLLMETMGTTETNAVSISGTTRGKSSTLTRENGGFEAAAHDVPSGPNPESNK